MAANPQRVQNRLLASLPDQILMELSPKLTLLLHDVRHTIFHEGATIDYVLFPTTGMLSLVSTLQNGVQAEVGVIGREGMFGAGLLAEVETTFTEVNVQMPLAAFRMSARDFRQSTVGGGPLRTLVLRYSEALHAQVGQTAACNCNHQLEQRLSRWLLMAHDRSNTDELPLTQEFIAVMLGVHRPSVSVSARILQRAGLIKYSRDGKITILDRAGLESSACECYEAVRKRYSTLLGN